MHDEFEEHIAAVRATYQSLVTEPSSRLTGGERLWGQFEDAVAAYRKHGRPQRAGVCQGVNELAVAGQILADKSLSHTPIWYEPEIVSHGPRFDFVAPDVNGQALYIEVKTVEPRTEDSDSNWAKFEGRQKYLTPGNHYIVEKEWMGAAIFGKSFAARSSFLDNTFETEAKFKDHNAVKPGHAILVFCGTGFAWKVDALEDFADFYRTGRHRGDDPFADMEQHAIEQRGAKLSRSLNGFAALMRKSDDALPSKCVYPVRGPRLP